LDFVISMWILHSIFLSIITPRYFTCFTEWMYRPLNVRSASIGLVDVRNRRHVLSFIIKYQRSHNNSNEMKQRCHFSTPSVPYMQVSSAKICRWMRKVWSITYKQPLRNGGRWGTLCYLCLYESRLRSSWTRLITPSRNFVEVLFLFFEVPPLATDAFLNNVPPISRKRKRSNKVSPRTFQTALVSVYVCVCVCVCVCVYVCMYTPTQRTIETEGRRYLLNGNIKTLEGISVTNSCKDRMH